MVGICLIILACFMAIFAYACWKKSDKKMTAISLALGVLILIVAGKGAINRRGNIKSERESLYYACCYIRENQPEKALSYCLNKTTKKSDEKSSALIKSVCLNMLGEQGEAKILLDSYSLSGNKDIGIIADLVREREISKENQKTKDAIYSKLIGLVGFEVGDSKFAELRHSNQDETVLISHINSKEYNKAIELGGKLARENSKKGKLLLARTIANICYNGEQINEDVITENKFSSKSSDKEKVKIKRDISNVISVNDGLENDFVLETNDANKNFITKKQLENKSTADRLVQKLKGLPARKALTLIHGIKGFEADTIRAELYFATGEEEKAFDLLSSMFKPAKALKNGKGAFSSFEIISSALKEGFCDSQRELCEFTQRAIGARTTMEMDMVREFISSRCPERELEIISPGFRRDKDGNVSSVSFFLAGDSGSLSRVYESKAEIFDCGERVSYEATKLGLKTLDPSLYIIASVADEEKREMTISAIEAFLRPYSKKNDIEVEILDENVSTYNAVEKALNSGKRVAIIISDGKSDYRSELTERARSNFQKLYTIALPNGERWMLENLALLTDGKYIEAKSYTDLCLALDKVYYYENPSLMVSYDAPKEASQRRDRDILIKTGVATERKGYVNLVPQEKSEEAPKDEQEREETAKKQEAGKQ